MPEAPVHKDHSIVPRKDKVRVTGQVPVMQPVTEAEAMQATPYLPFWLGVLASDTGHHPASCGVVYDVH